MWRGRMSWSRTDPAPRRRRRGSAQDRSTASNRAGCTCSEGRPGRGGGRRTLPARSVAGSGDGQSGGRPPHAPREGRGHRRRTRAARGAAGADRGRRSFTTVQRRHRVRNPWPHACARRGAAAQLGARGAGSAQDHDMWLRGIKRAGCSPTSKFCEAESGRVFERHSSGLRALSSRTPHRRPHGVSLTSSTHPSCAKQLDAGARVATSVALRTPHS